MMTDPEPFVEPDDVSDRLSRETLYELLSDRRRRHILTVLSGRTDPVALTDLARELAGREADDSDAPAEACERIAVELHHVHAPKLAAADLVAFDRANGRVEPTEDGRCVGADLERLSSE